MKQYTIKSTSLLYRLAHVYADYNDYFHKDICSYARKVIRGFFNIMGGLILFFIAGGSLVHTGLGIWFTLFHGLPWQSTWQMAPVILAAMLAVVVAGLMAALYVIAVVGGSAAKAIQSGITQAAAKEQPPFFITAYRSFKQKTCVPVKVDYRSK